MQALPSEPAHWPQFLISIAWDQHLDLRNHDWCGIMSVEYVCHTCTTVDDFATTWTINSPSLFTLGQLLRLLAYSRQDQNQSLFVQIQCKRSAEVMPRAEGTLDGQSKQCLIAAEDASELAKSKALILLLLLEGGFSQRNGVRMSETSSKLRRGSKFAPLHRCGRYGEQNRHRSWRSCLETTERKTLFGAVSATCVWIVTWKLGNWR